MWIYKSLDSPSQLTFTIFEEPLTPFWLRGLWSELITLSTSSCLLIRSALPYGPPRGSRQAGRQGWGKCWIPVGHWLHKLLLMREVLWKKGLQVQTITTVAVADRCNPKTKGGWRDLIKRRRTRVQEHMRINTCKRHHFNTQSHTRRHTQRERCSLMSQDERLMRRGTAAWFS